METFAQLCRNMSKNPNILTFSDIASSAAQGASLGAQKTKTVEGVMIGAIAGVAIEASNRVVVISAEMLQSIDSSGLKTRKSTNKPG